MEGRVWMSMRERRRLGPLKRIVDKEISLAIAAQQMDVGYRQAGRLLRRYREEGDAGLIHRACGKPSPRLIDKDFKEAVLELVRTKYPGFGPTLASETLAERDGRYFYSWLMDRMQQVVHLSNRQYLGKWKKNS